MVSLNIALCKRFSFLYELKSLLAGKGEPPIGEKDTQSCKIKIEITFVFSDNFFIFTLLYTDHPYELYYCR
jgi:hypothetical protein